MSSNELSSSNVIEGTYLVFISFESTFWIFCLLLAKELLSDDLLFSIEETSTVVFFKSGEVDTYVTVALFRTGSELF